MKAITYSEYGGPDVLKFEERSTPVPGPGQALVKVAAAGVNFIDVYQREGGTRSACLRSRAEKALAWWRQSGQA
jgi:NADPH:quinone reductase-like Zn-dependent oxidoreductase